MRKANEFSFFLILRRDEMEGSIPPKATPESNPESPQQRTKRLTR